MVLASCANTDDDGITPYTGYGANLPNGAYLTVADVSLVAPRVTSGHHVVGKRVAELAALDDDPNANGILGAVLATATAGVPHTDANGPNPLVWVVSLEGGWPHTYLFAYVDAYSGKAIGESSGRLPGYKPPPGATSAPLPVPEVAKTATAGAPNRPQATGLSSP
jgi:hypothetical protein